MATPNMVILLGNHEYMMLDYPKPDPDPIAKRRWNRNGNRPTLDAFLKLKAREQKQILDYLKSLPAHLEVEVNGQWLYLAHGFPGANFHDEVWSRPELNPQNPTPGHQVIIGHAPVLSLAKPEDAKVRYVIELESEGDHLRISHAEGFIDIDCGCGHRYPIKALTYVLLEYFGEIYTIQSNQY